jgi:methionyl-tRNA formyltransferase
VAFFGTPDFSARFLQGLIEDPYFEVVGVITQPDEPVGRKKILTAPPTKILALEKCIQVFQPVKMKDEEFLKAVESLKADVFIIVAYGRILPQALLELPRLGCINVHPSLLPKWRGPSPMQSAIVAGDSETGISVMKIDAEMDHGPILAQKAIALQPSETVESLTNTVVHVGVPLLLETLKTYHAGMIKPVEQDHSRATFCKLLTREDGQINLVDDPKILDQKIRAYNPWPGTWTILERAGKPLRVKILKAKLEQGMLELTQVQPEGGKPMTWADFERGQR